MKASLYVLPWVLTLAPAWSLAASPAVPSANPQLRLDVRDALQAQGLAGQAAERREEAAVGRRLTEAERARLREQLRQEWVARTDPQAPAAVSVKTSAPMPASDTAADAMTATAGAAASAGDPAQAVQPPGVAHATSH